MRTSARKPAARAPPTTTRASPPNTSIAKSSRSICRDLSSTAMVDRSALSPSPPSTVVSVGSGFVGRGDFYIVSAGRRGRAPSPSSFYVVDLVKEEEERKMLAILKEGLADPPKELKSPFSSLKPKLPEETLKGFHVFPPK